MLSSAYIVIAQTLVTHCPSLMDCLPSFCHTFKPVYLILLHAEKLQGIVAGQAS